jgi:hypothetical protein
MTGAAATPDGIKFVSGPENNNNNNNNYNIAINVTIVTNIITILSNKYSKKKKTQTIEILSTFPSPSTCT